jgi:plasmid stabilization system protein ParE
MQLRWTEEAAADLEHIADYLFEHGPEEAPEIITSIYNVPVTSNFSTSEPAG